MKSKLLLIAAITAGLFTGHLFADDIPDMLNDAKSDYWAWMYYSTAKKSIEAADLSFQLLVENLIGIVPVLSGFHVYKTNYFYSYNSDMGYQDTTLYVSLTMSNADQTLVVKYDNDLAVVENYLTLVESFKYLADGGNYAKTNYATTYSSYDCIISDNQKAYFPFMYTEEDEKIMSGVVIEMNYTFKKSLTEAEKRAVIDQKSVEMLKLLKTKYLKAYLQ